jgi:hypothetical protein
MRDKNWRKIAIASLVALGLYVIGSVIYAKFETLEAQGTAQELAEPVEQLCNAGGEAAVQLEDAGACQQAEQIPDPDDPEQQDAEIQDPEHQDSETQDPEHQDIDPNDPDINDLDPTNDPDIDDPELQESEIQEPEFQEGEIQEPENQNAPVCKPGFTEEEAVWSGPDGLPNTGDERTVILCMKTREEGE